MRVWFALAALVGTAIATPAAARVALTIDASQAQAVLDAFERGDPTAADAVAAMRPTQELIRHHEQFSETITIETWRESLRSAISGSPRQDNYRFGQARENIAAIRASIDVVSQDPAAFGRDLEAIIAPYTPPDMALNVRVGFVIGTPGLGWTDDPNEFFYDMGRTLGDLEGAKAVCAHELYHLVMARVQPDARLPEDEALGRVERILLGEINEGMATHVGRFTHGETGAISRQSLGFEAQNLRRMRLNFRLVDALLMAAARSDVLEDGDAVNILGGSFNEPGYYVFRDMAAAIEAARGREFLVSLLSQAPTKFMLAYDEVAASDAPRFQAETMDLVRQLDRRLSRR